MNIDTVSYCLVYVAVCMHDFYAVADSYVSLYAMGVDPSRTGRSKTGGGGGIVEEREDCHSSLSVSFWVLINDQNCFMLNVLGVKSSIVVRWTVFRVRAMVYLQG